MVTKKESKHVVESQEVCAKCDGTEFVMTDKGAVPCECVKTKNIIQKHQAARIPTKYINKSINTFDKKMHGRKDVAARAQSFIKDYKPQGQGLLMLGGVGVGKTHIAVAILKEVIAKGHSGLYYNVIDLLREIRATYNNDSAVSENDLVEMSQNVDLLVLDDLGAERTTMWVLDRLYDIINKRYEEEKTIIVTTNCMNSEELLEKVGHRITSRLREMCHKWELPEGDYRKQFMSDF